MKLKNSHSHFHRRVLPWAAALLVLLTVGAGSASADSRKSYQDEDRYEDHRGARGGHGYHGKGRYHRDDDSDHHYDRNRRHHRRQHHYDRHHRRHHHRHYTDHRYRRHGYYDDHHYRYNRHRIRHFDIPKLILHELLHSYRPYRYGRVYYSQHRHYHEIYRFPVYSEYGVEYYPYAYCEGKFFGRGHFRGGRPVFDVHIRF